MQIDKTLGTIESKTTVQESVVTLLALYVKSNGEIAANLRNAMTLEGTAAVGDGVFVSKSALNQVLNALDDSVAQYTAHAPTIVANVLANTPAERVNTEAIGAAAAEPHPFGEPAGTHSMFDRKEKVLISFPQTYVKAGAPDRVVNSQNEIDALPVGYKLAPLPYGDSHVDPATGLPVKTAPAPATV